MEYLPGAGQMKAADAYTIHKFQVPSLTLMERAAESCVRILKESGWSLAHVCIVCGSGNNGGDGFAIGRLLLREKKGFIVTAVMAGNISHCTDECRKQMELFEKAGGCICKEYVPAEYSVIIDALFGVGLSREITGRYMALLEEMNRSNAKKFAVDIPSGISADTGNVLGTAFLADKTVTFQNRKFGMEIYPGKSYCGDVTVADIGISDITFAEDKNVAVYLSEEDYRSLLPVRKEDSHKGSYGKVLIIAGSKGMSGAAYFNAKAAYLAGAGLVRIYTTERNRSILQQLLPEAILTTYEEEWASDRKEELDRAVTVLQELFDWADVVCIGSGIGTEITSERILKTTLQYCKQPCVIDADGINLLSKYRGFLTNQKETILTPHMKEMSRLTGLSVSEIKKNRLAVLREFTEESGCTLVLKDARTVIKKAGERFVTNRSGNNCMAKAGSGDVLAGIITGLLAQTVSSYDAAILGVYIHGRAGDLARERKGVYSVMAEDLMSQIGTVMKKLSET